jgi:hypothetical protein
MTNAFNDIFGSGFRLPDAKAADPKPEKGVQIHGQKIDGVFYVRAADVVALLQTNGVLPGIAEKLRKAAS